MSKEIRTNDLRKFGITFGIVLFIIGTIQLVKGRLTIFPWFYAAGSLSFILGIFVPALLKPIYLILTKTGRIIGNIITGLVLMVVFYCILTPIGLIAKLFGKYFLDIDWRKKSNSYWIKKEQSTEGIERYERQY